MKREWLRAAILCSCAILSALTVSCSLAALALLGAVAISAAVAYMREGDLGSHPSTHRASSSMVALAAPNTDARHPQHLIVMVNGIMGSASDWKFAADQLRSRFGSEVLVHCSSRNAAILTFDGVDVMGHRLAEEVKEVVDSSPGLRRVSFIAHSLGGLIARYAIGQLYNPYDNSCWSHYDENLAWESFNGTILGLQPVNFVSVATPHLGSRGNGQLPLLGGLPFLEKVALSSAHWVVGRTGKHLFLTDGDESHAPLLQRMVRDCEEGQFFSALGSFERRVIYANINFDHMVGGRTATIRRESEASEIKEEAVDIRYPHIVYVENVPPETKNANFGRNTDSDAAEEEMISGLRQLSWQRVYVSFSRSAQKLAAHSTIQRTFPSVRDAFTTDTTIDRGYWHSQAFKSILLLFDETEGAQRQRESPRAGTTGEIILDAFRWSRCYRSYY